MPSGKGEASAVLVGQDSSRNVRDAVSKLHKAVLGEGVVVAGVTVWGAVQAAIAISNGARWSEFFMRQAICGYGFL